MGRSVMNDTVRRLVVDRESTMARIAELTRSFDDIVASVESVGNDDEHDPEGATIGFERAQILALLDATRAHLLSIDDAIARVGHGSYGRCATCGEPIPVERLEALPNASRCVSCARTKIRSLG